MQSYPKKKWAPRSSHRSSEREGDLQVFANEYLDLKRIKYFRIHDGFFRWMKMCAPQSIQKWFFGMFGGMPDNCCFIPIGDRYSLCLHLELKSKAGKLHGKQKHGKNWMVARSPEEVREIVDRFEADAGRLAEYEDI